MFQITVEGQKQNRLYDCEDIATLVYSHLILLYPTLNIKLYEGYSINWDVLEIILRKIVWNV